MKLSRTASSQVIWVSLLVAFLFMVIPLPDWVNDWRPNCIMMVWIYWCLALPKKVGIGRGWFLGLLLDVQQGTLLGQNALAFSLITYFMIHIYKRFRSFPLTQQSCCIGLIVLCYLFFDSCVRGMIGTSYYTWSYWMSSMTSTLLWPWLFIILRDLRRRYYIA